jgi:anti-sigma factor RsiW
MSEHIRPEDLELYILGAWETLDASAIEAHVAECEVCADALVKEARLELMLGEVAAESAPEPVPLAHPPIPRMVSQLPTDLQESGWRRHGKGLAVAAAAVIAAVVVLVALPIHINGKGSIVVVIDGPDNAHVFLDGVDSKRGSVAILEKVPAGEHTVAVEADGFKRFTTQVLVRPDETNQVRVALRQAEGRLTIVSPSPGAPVFVDGEAVGRTPVTVDLTARTNHTVSVEGPGFWDESRKGISLEPGERRTIKLGAARTLPDRRATSVQVKVKPAGSSSRLFVSARPWANVLVDGERRGPTPLMDTRVRPGKHTLTFLDEERQEIGRMTIVVEAGEEKVHRAELRAAPRDTEASAPVTPPEDMAELDLRVMPWAEVWIDDENVGITPFRSLRLLPGDYDVRLENKTLGVTKKLRVRLDPGERKRVKVNLTVIADPKRAPAPGVELVR